ncbi:MAG: low molecular weight phosphatase family protein [Dermatophilaceae bacterium]
MRQPTSSTERDAGDAVLRPGSVLVVCTGNVCRSPYVERRLRQDLADTGVEVTSAGSGALVDSPMEPHSRALLEASGADGASFRARQLSPHLVASADLVIATARENRSAAARLHSSALRTSLTLRDLADLLDGVTAADVAARHATGSWVTQVLKAALARRAVVPARQRDIDITDPFGQSFAAFQRMAAEVEPALRIVVPVLRGVRKA